MCGHLEILSVRSANLPAGEGVAFLSRNVANYNIGIEVVDISADYLSVNLVGYGVAVDSEGALDGNIMCGHLEILSVRSANLPAGEGIAFLSRNGSDYNIGIEVVDISADYLSANLVGYGVLVDFEGAVEANVLCRHFELAVNNLDNVGYVSGRSPAGESVACLFRMSGSYGYVSAEGVGIDVAKLRFVTLLILIEVGHLEIVRNPLCIQMQAGHQNRSRIGGLASCVGVPTAELITVPSRETGLGIVERRIVGAGLGAVVIGCIFTEIRMVGNVDCNVLDVAVNMDIQLAVFNALILDGVPYDIDAIYVEVVAQNRGIGRTLVGAVFVPVARSKETEVGRNFQIGLGNAVYDIGNRIALSRNFFRAFLGERADIASVQGQAVYAAVGLAVRQVEFFALIIVVLRGVARRQKYEILSRGLGLRLDRGTVGSPLCVQVHAAHQNTGIGIRASCIGVPASEFVTVTGRQTGFIVGKRRVVAGLSALFVDLVFTKVRMVGNINRNVLDVAVNVVAVNLPLDGVPYNLSLVDIEITVSGLEKVLDLVSIMLGLTDIGAAVPVVCSEETEVFRLYQIVGAKAIGVEYAVLRVEYVISIVCCLFADFGKRTCIAVYCVTALYTAVRLEARQVVCSALVFAARRLITVWQKYEVLGFRIPIRCEVDVRRCHADFIFRRIAYYIIFLRNVSRTFGNGGISAIARLRAVRTAVCAAVRRSRCGILILVRLCLGLRRSGNSGSFSGVCFNGSGIYHGTVFVHERLSCCDVLIVGQRPARAHGQHHDSRKSSCEQTFARILF